MPYATLPGFNSSNNWWYAINKDSGRITKPHETKVDNKYYGQKKAKMFDQHIKSVITRSSGL